mmetsp:Transcript_8520/g.12163  ORF Transcript_8520/g.12163 Transcript_8520/m.12163 type:complete len:90 (+) Transcript_8520:36-305(+)
MPSTESLDVKNKSLNRVQSVLSTLPSTSTLPVNDLDPQDRHHHNTTILYLVQVRLQAKKNVLLVVELSVLGNWLGLVLVVVLRQGTMLR